LATIGVLLGALTALLVCVWLVLVCVGLGCAWLVLVWGWLGETLLLDE